VNDFFEKGTVSFILQSVDLLLGSDHETGSQGNKFTRNNRGTVGGGVFLCSPCQDVLTETSSEVRQL
jgi:hypothetical protein